MTMNHDTDTTPTKERKEIRRNEIKKTTGTNQKDSKTQTTQQTTQKEC